MADQAETSLDILIRTLADTAGADKIQAALDKTTGAVRETGKAHAAAGEAASGHSKHIEGLHRACHALNQFLPGLGAAMQAVFSPIGAAVSIGVMALEFFREKIKETNEEMKRLEEEAAKPLSERLAAQREGVVSLATSLAGLQDRLGVAARGEVTLKEATEAAVAAANAQHAEAQALGAAQQANDLARLEMWHAAGLSSEQEFGRRRLEIEQRFREKKRQLEEEAEAAEFMIRRRAQGLAEADQPGLTAAAEEAHGKAARAAVNLASFEQEKPAVEKRREDTAKALREFEAKHPEWARGFARVGPEVDAGAAATATMRSENLSQRSAPSSEDYTVWVKLQAAQKAAEQAFQAIPRQETERKLAAESAARESERADRKAEENAQAAAEGKKDLERRRDLMDARHEANQQLTGTERDTVRVQELAKSPIGAVARDDVTAAQRTALALEQHKDVSDESKRQLEAVASAVAGHRVSLQEAVKMLDWSAKSIGNFTMTVDRLATVMSAMASMVSSANHRIDYLQQQVATLQAQMAHSANHM